MHGDYFPKRFMIKKLNFQKTPKTKKTITCPKTARTENQAKNLITEHFRKNNNLLLCLSKAIVNRDLDRSKN